MGEYRLDEHLLAALRSSLHEEYDLAVSGLRPLPGGHIHDVWVAESGRGLLVLKRYRGYPGADPSRLFKSLELQRATHEAGLPVPDVVANRRGALATETRHGWVTVQEFSDGAHRDPGRFTLALAASVGHTLGRLHRALADLAPPAGGFVAPDASAVRRECETWLERLQSVPDPDEWDRMAAEEAEFRLRLLPARAVGPHEDAADAAQWTHGDFYPGNLLFDACDRVVAVLDWDFAAFRRRGGEVARAAFELARSGTGALDRERFDAFFSAYLREVPLSPAQRRLMFRQLLFHQLAVLYPLAFRRLPGAQLPQGWQALARRRYEVVREIERHLDTLTQWAAAARP